MQEVELALVVCDGQRILDEFVALRKLGDYLLQSAEAKSIRDIYVDTPNGTLGSKQLSLRVRRVNGRQLLTLKSGAEAIAGLKVRRELELDYAPETLLAIRAELEREGVHLPATTMAFRQEGEGEALAALRSWGLVVIQERRNDRQVRAVVAADGATVAELTLDAVTFSFADQTIRHYEIEIELQPGVSSQVAREVADLLRARFPGSLRPWTVPKLALGMWLERLFAEGKLSGRIREDGMLAPAVYALIAQLAEGRQAL